MKNKNTIIILIVVLLIFIVLGVIALVVVNQGKESNTSEENNSNISGISTKLVEEADYIEITVGNEDSKELEYKDLIKIEDKEDTEKLLKMINNAKEHEFNGAFGFDVPPYAIIHLKNGDEMMVTAIDDLEMEGEETGNYILVMVNDNDEQKKAYKVDEKIETEIISLYSKAEKNKKDATTSKTK